MLHTNHFDIVFGNVIGSNNFNLFIILGIAGLITPLTVQSTTVWKEIPFSFVAVLIIFILTSNIITDSHDLSRWDGGILIVLFASFIYYVYTQMKTEASAEDTTVPQRSNLKIWRLILVGLVLLSAGGKLVVNSAVDIATLLGVSETIIGLTIVAAGTSLPELATSIVATTKNNNDIAIGNIIGSNIFNLFLILGVSALINPLEYNPNFNTELGILGAGTIFLFVAMFSGGKKKLDRWEAAILLISYSGYLSYLVYLEMV